MIDMLRDNPRARNLLIVLGGLLVVWGVAATFASRGPAGEDPKNPQLHEIDRLQRQADAAAVERLGELSQGGDVRVMGRALIALARTDRKEGLEPVYRALDDHRPEVQYQALVALGQTKQEVDSTRIVEVLKSTRNPAVYERAIDTLGHQRAYDAMPHLIAALHSTDAGVRARGNAAIMRILGFDFGFDPDGLPAERGKRIAWITNNWRKYEAMVKNYKKRLREEER